MDLAENSSRNKTFDLADTSFEQTTSSSESISAYHDVPKPGPSQRPIGAVPGKAIDVDSFANLLMRGVASPAESEQSSRSSFTLPSFGISDPCTLSHQPSQPSHSGSRRESAESSDMKTPMTAYGVSRLQESKGLEKPKVPPPPPKSRHGKTLLLAPKGPQTVPFDAFFANVNDTITPRSASDSLPVTSHDLLPKETGPLRSSSYSTASLPLPSTFDHQREKRLATESVSTASLASPTLQDAKKAAPPPVPLARRTTVTRRARANTASSNISQNDEGGRSYAASITESVDSGHKPAPPPPRRNGSSSNIAKSSDFHNDSGSSHDVEARSMPSSVFRQRSDSGASLTSYPPRPPARRRSSRHSTELTRQNSFGAGSAPHSRRTSTDLPRSSFDSGRWLPSDSQYGAPIAEESRGDAPASNPRNFITPERANIDVLADMEAFQREIDAMRAKSQ